MSVTVVFVLWHASAVRRSNVNLGLASGTDTDTAIETQPAGRSAWICFAVIMIVLTLFSVFYASMCEIEVGKLSKNIPWLLWAAEALFAYVSVVALRNSRQMFILNLLMFTIVYMVIGVMGYGWYLPEICALFFALAVAAGISAGYSADKIAETFIGGAKDIFSAALIIGFAAGIIVILKDGNVIDAMLGSMASALEDSGKAGALASMYGIQTFINLFIRR